MATSDSEEYLNRRESDRRLDQFLLEIREMIDSAIDRHVKGHHAGLTASQIQDRLDMQMEHDRVIPELREETKKIIDALDGHAIVDEDGFVIGREPGLVEVTKNNAEILDVLDHRTNGGVHVTYKASLFDWSDYTRNQKLTLVAVAATFMVAFLPSLIDGLQDIATWFGGL